MASMAERFAANLRRLREAAGLSQEELAFRAQIHRTQISLLETGQRLPRFEPW
jgi:transcriptional regulator with XRE-family HTH domain